MRRIALLVFLVIGLGSCGGDDTAAYCEENPFAEPCGGVIDDDGNGVDDSVDREMGRQPELGDSITGDDPGELGYDPEYSPQLESDPYKP